MEQYLAEVHNLGVLGPAAAPAAAAADAAAEEEEEILKLGFAGKCWQLDLSQVAGCWCCCCSAGSSTDDFDDLDDALSSRASSTEEAPRDESSLELWLGFDGCVALHRL